MYDTRFGRGGEDYSHSMRPSPRGSKNTPDGRSLDGMPSSRSTHSTRRSDSEPSLRTPLISHRRSGFRKGLIAASQMVCPLVLCYQRVP